MIKTILIKDYPPLIENLVSREGGILSGLFILCTFPGIQMFTLLLLIPGHIKKFSWWRADIEKFLAAGIDRMRQDLSALIFGSFYQEKERIELFLL